MRRAALPFLAVALLAAGCGEHGAGSGRPPAALLAAAIQDRDETGSFRLRFRLSSDLGGTPLVTSSEGVANADFTASRTTSRTAGSGAPPTVAIVADGALFYSAEGLPRGKRWIRSSQEVADAYLTPEQFVELVRAAEDVEDAGSASVDGRRVTRLRATVPRERVDDVTDVEVMRTIFKQLGGRRAPPPDAFTATAEVWVDAEERIARDVTVIRAEGFDGALRLTTDYLEYDVPLGDIEAPDPATVVDEDDVPR